MRKASPSLLVYIVEKARGYLEHAWGQHERSVNTWLSLATQPHVDSEIYCSLAEFVFFNIYAYNTVVRRLTDQCKLSNIDCEQSPFSLQNQPGRVFRISRLAAMGTIWDGEKGEGKEGQKGGTVTASR